MIFRNFKTRGTLEELSKKNILNKYGCNNVITSLSAKAYKSKKFVIGDTFFDKFLNIKKKIYMVSVKKL